MKKETFKRRIRKITAFAAAVAMAVTVTMPGEIFGNIDFGITVFAEENGYVNGFCTTYTEENGCTNTNHTGCNGYQPATDSDSDGVYEIGNAGQLYWFAALVNGTDGLTKNKGANAILTNNITINNNVLVGGELNSANESSFRKWTPIGKDFSNAFTGTFNGDNHSIRGLYFNEDISIDGFFCAGLFGKNNGNISNINIEDSYFSWNAVGTTSCYLGTLVGSNGGKITNCNSAGTVYCYGSGYVWFTIGGICGAGGSSGKIENCNNTGKVSVYCDNAGDYKLVGGVCGGLNGTIDNCRNTGDVTVSGSSDTSCFNIGGVCGGSWSTSSGKIENCKNSGNITSTVSRSEGYDYIGGICGGNQVHITGCHNSGTVEGQYSVGGVCGGQIFVYSERSLANYYGTITNCYNTGTVKGTEKVGGICGLNEYAGTIENCYSAGSVSGTSSVGGVCGENYTSTDISTDEINNGVRSRITNCYYDKSQYGGEAVGWNQTIGSVFAEIGILEKVEGKTSAEFTEGEVCYLLNNGETNGTQVWYQALDSGTKEAYPNLDTTNKESRTVYASKPCPINFSNTDNLAEEEHNYVANSEYTKHTCTKCGETHDAVFTADDDTDTISVCHRFGSVTLM